MFHTVGIDVGSSAIKCALMSFDEDGKNEKLIGTTLNKIRKRDTQEVIRMTYDHLLESHDMKPEDICYIATTGEGEMVDFRSGHFYTMTSHARGAIFMNPDARAVVDAGALHSRALIMDDRSKVLGYRMTSQCASGSGQFLENISRYLGIGIEDVGPKSVGADNPEVVSGICAVLAETDVINMVSRGISAGNILKGIHLSMARRLVNLLRMIKAEGKVLVTGGLSRDVGLTTAMQELATDDKKGADVQICSHELAPFAGAIGSAIWGGFRHVKLREANA
ncbi:MAG: benzoyl-CoA reductase subunit D [Bdellovibrionaceae bacterium]|nr:benzoyl-CoA reductase subunit D [Bdellovibrionales bacterium]MCB9083815.1 benzoyl-CoA reductase subunit D [Pseudobdellovibrionaceae bacterium]